MAGLGTPYTVLMNGLGPALSSWSAGHLLHSLLGGEDYKRTVCGDGHVHYTVSSNDVIHVSKLIQL